MKIAALAGGVGGAKLVHGLAQLIHPEDITAIVNTGDDFEHYGLYISPDIDTVCYTLAGLANPDTGWGRRCETWNVFEELQSLNAPSWFKLGDKDLATHLERTRLLRNGLALSEVTQYFCDIWKIRSKILPMTDDRVRTIVYTRREGNLSFQDYFVAKKCTPEVTGFDFDGIITAKPAPGVEAALNEADVVIFCPSNPWVSIDPILQVPGIQNCIANKVIVAISPIIGGKTIKGPAAKMFHELGIPSTAAAVADHYKKYLSGFIIDDHDIDLVEKLNKNGFLVRCKNILMKNEADRRRVAGDVIDMCSELMSARKK